jgi:hypothetical protein
MSKFTQLEPETDNDINKNIQWTCETCTFLNHVALQECEMCATVNDDTNDAANNNDLDQAKQILDKLQGDIQTHILEEYVKPQVIADEISNMIKEFDEQLMSEKCQRLEWQVLTEVVSKIINNKAALAQMCEKDTMGFKDSYEQHFIKGKNTFTHPSWTPLGSMCAELTMRQWH